VVDEELLELADIQGAVVPGFKKDHAALVALRIDDVPGAKRWLRDRAAEVARADEVLAFNRLFSVMRVRRSGEAQAPKAVWLSVSVSAGGLTLLRGAAELAAFDPAFVHGMFASALADPPPARWTTGGSANAVPHLLLTLAADDPVDLDAELARLAATFGEHRAADGSPALSATGPPQCGATLPGERRGHEHFGFKDGVSQPAVRGRASAAPDDFVEPRRLALDDPDHDLFAVPGRPLVWPGQFLIGYQRQNRLDLVEPTPAFVPKLSWQRNGSYLVYRRLQQRVDRFWRFCHDGAATLGEQLGRPVAPEQFAALLVGRWPSGAPLVRSPAGDDPALAAADDVVNDFLFSVATPPVTLVDGSIPAAAFPAPQPDPDGQVCPFVAHIRKVNPRDDPTDTSGPRETRVRLLLRRGIPYGAAHDPDHLLDDDGVDRGLLFLSYQSSLGEQFEFVTKTWANRPDSPHDSLPPTGHDPLIGQNSKPRFVRLPTGTGADGDHPASQSFDLPADPWVLMTGGGYFFTPSISALAGPLADPL
jgi:Dyp-type peroxidase family